MQSLNLIIAGTGGQGVVLIGKILGGIAIKANLRIRVGEVHGVSQRGGSVLSFIRIGLDIFSPTVPIGTGHLLLGLEPVEALRSVSYISPKGLVVLNTRAILPNLVKVGVCKYPKLVRILDLMKRVVPRVACVDATQEAITAGSAAALNMFMLGVLFGFQYLAIPESVFREVIEAESPKKFLETNLKAFNKGVDFAKKCDLNGSLE